MALSVPKILRFASDPQPATPPSTEAEAGAENRQSRPEAWEEDFSRNTLDDQPFTVEPPISAFPLSEVREKYEGDRPESLVRLDRTIELFIENDPHPIPIRSDREGYLGSDHVAFWVSGLIDYLKIEAALAKYEMHAESIFEFGCATGRVLRHFCAHGNFPEVWGSDLNFRHVRWVMEHLPKKIRMLHNHTFPTLPIPDNSLDLVCAFSVFTHIDTFETAWVSEIYRIMRSGGMGYITLHTEDTWNAMGQYKPEEIPRVRIIRESGRFDDDDTTVFDAMPSDRMIFRHTQSGPYRGCIYHSEAFARDLWGRFFEVLEIIPNYHGKDQSVMLIRKK